MSSFVFLDTTPASSGRPVIRKKEDRVPLDRLFAEHRWIGVLITEDSSFHWPTKRIHVYSETSRRAALEFVCIFGHDGLSDFPHPYVAVVLLADSQRGPRCHSGPDAGPPGSRVCLLACVRRVSDHAGAEQLLR